MMTRGTRPGEPKRRPNCRVTGLVATLGEGRSSTSAFKLGSVRDGSDTGKECTARIIANAGWGIPAGILTTMTTASSSGRIVWVTNMAAPYRIPVWGAISHRVQLAVWLLQSDSVSAYRRSNRNEDWLAARLGDSIATRLIKTVVIPRGEARYYVSGPMSSREFDGVDAVVIGGWESPAYWMVSRAARRAGARRVGFYESHSLTRKYRGGAVHRIRTRFFASLDAIVVPGIAARDALVSDGIDPDRIHQGFNPVDGEAMAARAAIVRDSLPPYVGPLRVLFIGQLIPRKNIPALLAAVASVPKTVLTIVGIGEDEAALREQIESSGIGGRVEIGQQVTNDAVPDLLATHDVLVLPSLDEVWGLVVNEALAAGIQCIVSDRAGVAPSVAGMPGVHIVEPTSAAIAAALSELVRERPAVIEHPEILEYTPERFADVFLEAAGLLRPS